MSVERHPRFIPSGVDVWEFSETCGEFWSPLVALWSWGLNYEAGDAGNPFPLFLDLIGYGVEEYGSRVSVWATSPGVGGLGYVEADYLADALRLWADDPHGVEGWVRALMESESVTA